MREDDEKVLRSYLSEVIRGCKKGDSEEGKSTCLYAKGSGRLLGRHKNRASARRQEKAIHSHGG